MHLTLASGSDPAFAPEAIDRAALDALADEMRGRADETLALVARRLDALPELCRSDAEALIARRDSVRSAFDALRALDEAGLRIRVHGDYHLGQVLRAEEDFVILDFEGEPARPLAERRRKQSPAKDVAGMMRSFGYAAYAALFAFTHHTHGDHHVLRQWADAWQQQVSAVFVETYLATMASGKKGRATSPVPAPHAWTRLLRAFVLDKALYELAYEINHRPDWVRIPLTGIRKLIDVSGGELAPR
jgi:maltose alpha-D-glucosyltransferase/alpha-amylase